MQAHASDCYAKPPQTCCQAVLLLDDALATAMNALHPMVSTTLQIMPGGLTLS